MRKGGLSRGLALSAAVLYVMLALATVGYRGYLAHVGAPFERWNIYQLLWAVPWCPWLVELFGLHSKPVVWAVWLGSVLVNAAAVSGLMLLLGLRRDSVKVAA